MSARGAVEAAAPSMAASTWPPDLVEAVAELLAEMLVADLREHPNLAPAQPAAEATGVSPRGPAHRNASPCAGRRSARPRRPG